MAHTSPRSLSTAGGALVAAGFVAAGAGGLYGLARLQPGMVVLSVLLVMGYSVAGYLLMSRRHGAFKPASAISVVLVLATLWVFRPEVASFIDAQFAYFLLFPSLAYLLAFAGAHLAAYGFARWNTRVLWPTRGTEAVTPLLNLCAATPVLGAFLLMYQQRFSPLDGFSTMFVVGGALLAAAAAVFGGVIAAIRRHPRFTLIGAGVGFLANVVLLYQFAGAGRIDTVYMGQLYALAGMLLAGFPLAMSVVAWVELENAKREVAPPTQGPKEQADAGR